MSNELRENLEAIEREKNIDKTVLLETLRTALLSACKKTFRDYHEYDIQIDPQTCDIKVLHNGKEIHNADFGRIAAQTAKQVILQKIREAERDSLFDEFSKKTGDIIVGTVHRVEKKSLAVDFGKTEGVLPIREQFEKDNYRQGDTIRALVLEVKKTPRGPEIILSRSHPNLVKRLFELEVPEINDGIVEVKGMAREAGSRSKIAVFSTDERVDCVGSCVGMRGQRVKNVVRELGGEKIDIVRWSEDTEAYIRNALSPAVLSEVHLDREKMAADVIVEDDQLSLAIGKKGQNVRLASKLTGWKIDVRSRSQKIPISSLDGVGEKTEKALKEAGIHSIKDILKATAEDLSKIPGIGEKTAEKIIRSAHRAIVEASGGIPSQAVPPAASQKEKAEEEKNGEASENGSEEESPEKTET